MAVEDTRSGMSAIEGMGEDNARVSDTLDARSEEIIIAQDTTTNRVGGDTNGEDIQPVDAGEANQPTGEQVAQQFPEEIAPDADNIVRLPAGVSLEDVELRGSDLVLIQPDGSEIVIANAALNVPTFYVEGAQIPQEALIAALEANDINVAAGPNGTLVATSGTVDSSGSNFGEPAPGIGDADPILDLLPPTALQFESQEREEPLGLRAPVLAFGDGFVEEDDLLYERGDLSDGNNEDGSVDAQTASGMLVSDFGSGGAHPTDALKFLSTPGGLTSQGEPIDYNIIDTGNGQLLQAFASNGDDEPRLVFTLELVVNGNTGSYVFTLYDQLDHALTDNPDTPEIEMAFEDILALGFEIEAKNGEGLTDSDTLNIGVQDDIPVFLGEGATYYVDEDDIQTIHSETSFSGEDYYFHVEGSLGTSPQDGPFPDGSYTGSPYDLYPGPAYIHGSLSSLFKVGSDEYPNQGRDDYGDYDEVKSLEFVVSGGDAKFTMIEDGLADLLALGLTSKDDGSTPEKENLLAYKLVENPDGSFTLFGYVPAEMQQGGGEGDLAAQKIFLPEYGETGRLIFKLDLQSDGEFEFRLYDQLDHPNPGVGDAGFPVQDLLSLDFSSLIQVSDYDGDTIAAPEGTFVVNVRDDVPELSGEPLHLTVDEDDIQNIHSTGTSPNDGNADGSFTGSPWNNNNGPAHIFGSLNSVVESGADENLTFSFLPEQMIRQIMQSLGLSSQGVELSYDLQGNTLYGFANADGEIGQVFNHGVDRPVFALEISENGHFDFKLFDQLDHDAPGDDYPGPDPLSDENYDLQDGLPFYDVSDIKFGYLVTATDHDGDSVLLRDSFSIRVRDDVPELADTNPLYLTVDEDDIDTDLSTGTSPNDGTADGSYTGSLTDNNPGAAHVSGSLASLVESGADENLTFGFISEQALRSQLQALGLRSHGGHLSYDVQGDTLYAFVNKGNTIGQVYNEGDDRLVFELKIGEDGDFDFQLFDQLDHDRVQGENYDLHDHVEGDLTWINFGSVVEATDYDGDSVLLEDVFQIRVRDDVPQLADTDPLYLTVDEDDIDTGRSTGTSPNDGTADGSYTGSMTNNNPGPAHVAGSLASLVESGADENLTFDFTDNALTLLSQLGLRSQGDHLSFKIQGHTLVGYVNEPGPNDRVVFKLRVEDDGDFDFKLFDQLDHDWAQGENFDLHDHVPGDLTWLKFGYIIEATDYDGDSVRLDDSFAIRVRDDVPELVEDAAPVSIELDEDDIATGLSTGSEPNDGAADGSTTGSDDVSGGAFSSGDLAILVNPGADEPLTFSFDLTDSDINELGLKSHGDLIVFSVVDTVDGQILRGIANDGTGDRTVIEFRLDADGSYEVELFDQLDHVDPASGADENIDLQNETGGTLDVLNIGDLIKATDADGDAITLGEAVTIQFTDDVPAVTLNTANLADNGLFFDGFTENGDAWGEGSGVATGTAGEWTINGTQLERVGDGYRGADSPTDSLIVDMEASPGNVEISQTVSGLSEGQEYTLTFEIGEGTGAADGSALLEVWWNGVKVGDYDPATGEMQTISLDVTAQSGDNELIFREVGTEGDNTGTYLANVRLTDLIIIDETPGVDADSDDTTDTAVSDLFAGITGTVGSDPDMGPAQFAAGAGAVVDYTAIFGADGPAETGSVVYTLGIPVDGVDSGLRTTEGDAILLYNEGDLIVGRFADGGDGTAAIAFHIDPETGAVAVAQYVSLHHPDTGSHDEGIGLAEGVLSVTVTVTDYDGDQATASTDISGSFRFEDDGPVANLGTDSNADEWLSIDETAGVQVDEVYGESSVFTDLANKGSDPDMDPQFAGEPDLLSNAGSDYGADGPGSAVYSLALAGASASGLFTSGADPKEIYLFEEEHGGKTFIVGRYDADSNGIDNTTDPAAFALYVDPTTGKLHLAQYVSLEHGDPFDPNEPLYLPDGLITATYTITDADGDQASDDVDLGGNVRFFDDAPGVSPNATVVVEDDDLGPDHLDFPTDPGDDVAPVNVSGTLNHEFGADGGGSIAWLTNVQTSGGASGLSYATDGDNLLIQQNGNTVLTVTLNPATGEYSVIQNPDVPLIHSPGGDENDQFFTLTYRVTDSDGDTKDGTLTIKVDDDLPEVWTATTGYIDEEGLSGGNAGDSYASGDLPGEALTATGSLDIRWGGDFLNPTVDGDGGPGDRSVAFDASQPGLAGLKSNGADVAVTILGDGTLVGYTGVTVPTSTGDANVVFHASLGDTDYGHYSVTLTAPLDHPTANTEDDLTLTFAFTAKDSDGDTASDTFSVIVDDDAPVPVLSTDSNPADQWLSVDETAGVQADEVYGAPSVFAALANKGSDPDMAPQFAGEPDLLDNVGSKYGADGPGSAVYSLSLTSQGIASGLFTSGPDSTEIHLFEEEHGGKTFIVGRYDAAGGEVTGDDPAAFALYVDPATGVLHLAQYVSLEHGNPLDANEPLYLSDGLIEATYTMTDFDGDAKSDSVDLGGNVRFFDDGPTASDVVAMVDDAPAILDDEDDIVPGDGIQGGPGDDGDGVTVSGNLGFDAGADGLKSVEVTSVLANGATLYAVYVDGTGQGTPEEVDSLVWTPDGSGGGTLTGSSANIANVFTLVVAANGDYTLTMHAPLSHPAHDADGLNNGPETEYEDNLSLQFGYTVTDGDDDTAQGSLTVNVDDDTPDATPEAASLDLGAASSVTESLGFEPGADGWGGASFDNMPEGLESGGEPIAYHVDGNVLTGYIGTWGVDADTIFTLTIDPENNEYTFDMVGEIDGVAEQIVSIGGSSSFGSGPSTSHVLTSGTDGTGLELAVLTGWDASGINLANWQSNTGAESFTQAEVNGSTSGWGVFPGFFSGDDLLRFDFGDDDFAGTAFSGPAVSSTSFEFTNFGGGSHTVKYVVHFTDGSANAFGDISFSGGTHAFEYDAPSGKFIDYVEVYANGENGKVDLVNVGVTTEGNALDLSFGVGLADGDGDVQNVALAVHVESGNEPPVISEISDMAVSDEGLAGGIADGDAGATFQDTTNSATDTGTVSATDPDGDVLTYSLGEPVEALSSGGTPIVWTGMGTGTLTGKAGPAGPTVIEITVDGAGATSVSLSGPIDHPVNSLEDDLDLTVPVTVTDPDGEFDTANMTVTLEDDMPVAGDSSGEVTIGANDTNLMLILDMSGSMDGLSGIGGSRLDVMKDAAVKLVQAYEDMGNVVVNIVIFRDGTAEKTSVSWDSPADAIAYINGLDSSDTYGGTNYEDAVAKAQDAYDDPGKLSGVGTVSYFLSDGDPDPNSRGLDDGEESDWTTFLNNNDILSYALGMGDDISSDQLDRVAYDGRDGGTNIDGEIVTDLNQLDDTLVSTVTASTDGNVVADGGISTGFGGDGGHILSIMIGGVTYTYDADADEITNDGGPGTEPGSVLTATTPAGATLEFDFATGDWEYTADGSTPQGTENFSFVLIDGDGDTDGGVLSVDVETPLTANPDTVITNIVDGSPIVIPTHALTWNDTGADGPMSITGVGNPVGGTASVGSVIFDPANPAPVVSTTTYEFDDVKQNTNDHFAYKFDVNTANFANLNALNPSSNSNYISGTLAEASNSQYNDIEDNDTDYWETGQPTWRGNKVTMFQFSIAETIASITQIAIEIEAGREDRAGSGDDLIVGIWNGSDWVQIGSTSADDGHIGTVNVTLNSNLSSYVDGSGKLSLVLFNEDTNDSYTSWDGEILVDNVEVKVSTSTPGTFHDGSVEYTVGDGSDTASAGVAIHGVEGSLIQAETDLGEILVGGAGDDTLIGGEGNDVLVGGDGSDEMTGNGGADLFVVSADTLDIAIEDVIVDYDQSEGDVVDLSALLDGTGATEGNINEFVKLDGGDLQVDANGSAGGENWVTVADIQSAPGEVTILFNEDGDEANITDVP